MNQGVKVSFLEAGSTKHFEAISMRGGRLKKIHFPATVAIIEHPREGVILFDTGYSARFFEQTKYFPNKFYSLITPVTILPEHTALAQLHTRGISTRDVRKVILSHFHADHIAGLRDFPDTKLVCSKLAWDSVKLCTGFAALRKAFLPWLLPASIEQHLNFIEASPLVQTPHALLPFTQAWDLLGDGELLIVALPGHAEGQLGAFIATESGWQLLAADAAWASEAYRDLRGPSELSFLIQHNRRQYYQTLHALNALHQNGQVSIHLAHETEVGVDEPSA